ncbi:SDR family oxidoreductase [Roseococcus sp. SYP-B2431]|uniref:SDR family NAD(P)-dependent oxidoreductase n=1 Tax=Roseococcus sp. SYP-B2431 TaxID=2496640 RepID=UPI00103EC778|nr:SDR family oxidoreductase [Roseococcus sp. SYP-B2431]TCH97671.1 SDR family oxidoreductase [Roseococcus sp. SYP-B2431]
MDMRLAVTGGASGIGLAIAGSAREAGWQVDAADRTPGEGITALDVTDAAAVARWVGGMGGLRGVVCSAGISAATPILETDPEVFRRILDVNLTGSFLVAQAAARAMVATGMGGSIVFVASVSGLRGVQGRVAYGASKAAVINMAQVLAIDLAPHRIRVNALCPAPIETPLVTRLHDAETRAQWLSRIPAGRYGRAEEVAQAALFLLDEARSSYITGHALPVDGGYAGAGVMA